MDPNLLKFAYLLKLHDEKILQSFNHVGLIQTVWMQKKIPSKCFIKRSFNIPKKIFHELKTLNVKIVSAKLKLETIKKEFSGNGTLSKL